MAALAAAALPSLAPARRLVAWLVRTRVAAAAADAVICLFFASLWLLFAGLTTVDIARLAGGGEDCLAVVAASKVISVAGLTLVLVFPFGMALLMASEVGAAAADIEAPKIDLAPARKSYAAAAREVLRDPVKLAGLAPMPFALLLCVGALLMGDSPVKVSLGERMGWVIYEVGALGTDTLFLFVTCPILTVSNWRAWRAVRSAL